ncbi:MAG: hypothetical protein AB1714_09285 [Acidobacteriota bacterium]
MVPFATSTDLAIGELEKQSSIASPSGYVDPAVLPCVEGLTGGNIEVWSRAPTGEVLGSVPAIHGICSIVRVRQVLWTGALSTIDTSTPS